MKTSCARVRIGASAGSLRSGSSRRYNGPAMVGIAAVLVLLSSRPVAAGPSIADHAGTGTAIQSQDSVVLALAEAVRRTLAGHPASDAASAVVDRSRAGLRGAQSARLPGLRVEAGGTRFQEPMIVAPLHGFDPTRPPQFDPLLLQGRATASYTLFDGGARGARIDGARAAIELADASATATTASLIERAVRAYVEVGAGREIVAANAARVSALEEERARTQRMLAAGSVPQVAMLRAEAALASASADHAAAVADLRRAEADLARLIGSAADSTARFALQSVTVAADAAGPGRDSLIVSALRANPGVERARAQVAAASAGVAEARAAWWPSLALNGGYNLFGSGAGDWTGEWQAALQVAFPLFTGGARAAAVDRSLAGLESADASLALARLEAAAEVDAGLARLAGARAQVEALTTAVEQFVAVADIEALSLRAGAGVQPDYLRAESDLLDARAALTRARAAEVGARVALARIAGLLDQAWLVQNLEVTR